MKNILCLAVLALFVSCNNSDDTPDVRNPSAPGLSYALSENDFSTTYAALRSNIQSQPGTSIVAEVNYKANAESVGKNLKNTRLIMFGNPSVGTRLLQVSQLAALDLPLSLLVWEDRDGNVFTGFNSTTYLSARYNVGGANTIQQMSTALTNFTVAATGGVVAENATTGISSRQGIFTFVSQNDFNTTYNNIRNAISDDNSLNIVAEVDHQANAQAVNLTLSPTRLIVFGNANLETPLINSAQTAGIDLPIKILVWEEADGTVNISYNNPEYLQMRHNFSSNTETVLEIRSLLADLAAAASN